MAGATGTRRIALPVLRRPADGPYRNAEISTVWPARAVVRLELCAGGGSEMQTSLLLQMTRWQDARTPTDTDIGFGCGTSSVDRRRETLHSLFDLREADFVFEIHALELVKQAWFPEQLLIRVPNIEAVAQIDPSQLGAACLVDCHGVEWPLWRCETRTSAGLLSRPNRGGTFQIIAPITEGAGDRAGPHTPGSAGRGASERRLGLAAKPTSSSPSTSSHTAGP